MPKRGSKQEPRAEHPLAWLWEPMEGDRGFALKSMFGAKVVYLDEVQRLGFAAGKEPWDGLFVCTSREHHDALVAEFPALRPHAILPKWLYLPASDRAFESTGKAIIQVCLDRDPRIGIVNTKKRASTRTAGRGPAAEGPGRAGDAKAGELRNVVNLGQASAAWLEKAGIQRFVELKKLGTEESCRRVFESGQMVSAMLAYAIEGAIQGVTWQELPREVRAELRQMVTRMKRA